MKTSRPYPSVTITRKGQRFLEGGHLWVYAEEIVSERNTAETAGYAR